MRAIYLTMAFMVGSFTSFKATATGKCKPPPWATKSIVKADGTNSLLTVICSGQGATLELAEMEAKNACDTTAANQFHSGIDVKDLAFIQDHDSAFNREVGVRSCVLNLTCQNPDVSTCSDEGIDYVWQKCQYDLTKAREGTPKECTEQRVATPDGKDAVANRNELTAIKMKVNIKGASKHQHGIGYILTLSLTPNCDDILVVGSNARRLPCGSNPLPISVQGGDREIVIRAKGYLPKTIVLDAKGKDNNVDVYLDLAD